MDLGQHCGQLKEITCSPAQTLTWTQSSHVNLVYHGNAISQLMFFSAKRNVGLREYHPTPGWQDLAGFWRGQKWP